MSKQVNHRISNIESHLNNIDAHFNNLEIRLNSLSSESNPVQNIDHTPLDEIKNTLTRMSQRSTTQTWQNMSVTGLIFSFALANTDPSRIVIGDTSIVGISAIIIFVLSIILFLVTNYKLARM